MTEPTAYTTAIIVAVPADDDPVNEHVIEDAHVTLHFMGEASTLDDAQVEEIKASLELMASNLYPFPADVAGTAEIGPNKSKVLLVQSEPLTKIRDLLATVPAVSTATAAAEQFPNWIPHLTLADADDNVQVEAPDIESVQIGSIELWLASEQHAFPLAKAAPGGPEEDVVAASMIAAGLKEFDANLHPRGRDGRFIEKFGVVKYLTGLGWAYGKVDGIYADEASGAVQITVTPSDLGGKPTGAESIIMSPKSLYTAPKKKAHLLVTDSGVQKTGGQGGSNPGGTYSIPNVTKPGAAADQFYVKTPKTKSHGANEALANALYEEAGVPVPEVDMASDGRLYSKIVKGKQDMAQQLNNDEWTDHVRRNFAVDAWLGNRDVFGLTYDNILTDEHGVPWRIDNGGALLYRAMGEKKTDFGSNVSELDVFRQGKKAKIYGSGMTKAQELDGAERVLAISPGQIEEMVATHGLPKSLADTLKARRLYIANYYGLDLPESKQPEDAEQPTTAPLVDPADLAANKGKKRGWFKTSLAKVAFLAQTGDKIETPDGKQHFYGVDPDNAQALSIVGQTAQLLAMQHDYGAAAEVMLKKDVEPGLPRPAHGSTISAQDLAAQRWQRGDKILSGDKPYKIEGWNSSTGAVMVQHGDEAPVLLDTFGKDKNTVWKVERWDPPIPDTLESAPEEPKSSFMDDLLAKHAETPPVIESMTDVTPVDTANDEWQSGLVNDLVAQDVEGDLPEKPSDLPPAQPGKTGQAAAAEAAIKADLDQPLPTGQGAPAPAKTTAPGGAKKMVIGDGTEAVEGAEVVSKKDGKTYKFVKPKGQYAVVTDPNGDDPKKQLLKLSSTMSQPGVLPAGDVDAELPKTASGEVPALGMMAVAKDGWAGEITMISPDGKFVFITDGNGKRKRKSTGAVTVTAPAAQPNPVVQPSGKDPEPKSAPVLNHPGQIKPYGEKPHWTVWTGEEKKSGFVEPTELDAADMVLVGYADGTHGLEPYTGQPLDSVAQNIQGKVATYGKFGSYLGAVSAEQMIQAEMAEGTDRTWQVIWGGIVGFTDGTTGPNGGLVLWGAENSFTPDPGYAFELPNTPQVLTLVGSEDKTSSPLPPLPTGSGFQTNDTVGSPITTVLYGDEAKTLQGWKGQISEGMEISLDGENWLKVQNVSAGGSVKATDINGVDVYLNAWSNATYALKAPALVDGDSQATGKMAAPEGPSVKDAMPPVPEKGQVYIDQLTKGDVVTLPNGEISIISGIDIEVPGDSGSEVYVTTMDSSVGETLVADLAVQKMGNIHAGPVDMPVGPVAPLVYPGVKINGLAPEEMQVLTYPEQTPSGNWHFAAMIGGDPDNVVLVNVGMGAGGQVGPNAHAQVHFANSATPTEAGVDLNKINALFDAAKTAKPDIDHYAQMTEQGLDYGTAQHQIFWDGYDYYRNGPSGLEIFNSQQQWVPSSKSGGTAGMTETWGGKGFQGKLNLPAGDVGDYLLKGSEDYKPKPGEAVAYGKLKSGSAVLVVSPGGQFQPDSPVYAVSGPNSVADTPFTWGEFTNSDFYTDVQVVHDPFSEGGPDKPTITHHQGPTPPTALAQRMATLGITPEPGQTFLAVTHAETGQIAVLRKNPDGTYQRWGAGSKAWLLTKWDLEDIQNPAHSGEGATFFTWTNTAGMDGSNAPVVGMPTGFQPFVPGEGQSVLKVTWPNGNQKAYLQKQPNGGWYQMGPDGTIDADSDAILSNHVVQQKLAGKGSQALTYDLLHPQPGGTKQAADSPPTLTNLQGGWTPDPGDKVIALHSYDGDPDPWLWVQKPGSDTWVPTPNTPDAAGILNESGGVPDLNEVGPGWTKKQGNSTYSLVYGGGEGGGNADAVDTAAPSFNGYVPEPGEEIVSYSHMGGGDTFYYVKKAGQPHWHSITDTGEPTDFIAIHDSDLPDNLGPEFGNDYKQEWPVEDAGGPPSADVPTIKGYTPQPGEKVVQTAGNFEGVAYVQEEPDGNWFQINGNTGEKMKGGSGVFDSQMQTYITGGNMDVVWDGGGAPAAATFGHHVPQPGTQVLQDNMGDYWAQKEPGGKFHFVKPNGGYSISGLIPADAAQDKDLKQVWPAGPGTADTAAPAGTFLGYQSTPGQAVIELVGPTGTNTLAKNPETGKWHKIVDGALTSDPMQIYTQDTVEWAGDLGDNTSGVSVNVLQGTIKAAPGDPVDEVDTGGDAYAGVTEFTPVDPSSVSFGGYTLSSEQQNRLHALSVNPMQGAIPVGSSLYAVETPNGQGGILLVRDSTGTWRSVGQDGSVFNVAFWSDTDAEASFQNTGYTLHKAQFGAPTAPPVFQTGPPPTMPITNWEGKVPDPATFGSVASPDDVIGLPAGSWIFLPNDLNGKSGVFFKTTEDVTDPANITASHWALMTPQKGVGDVMEVEGGSDGWTIAHANNLYLAPSGPKSANIPATPTATGPAAQATPEPSAPSTPQYPGAVKPSQEDINAWGGDLTKDGYIPSSGMFVSGKGPMTGKVISVSKDKTKATVLTSDGKKTTRLISALKTDKTANYQAYAAPITAKDIPQGMPLAVDTVQEALTKTIQDGKFRAILTAAPGVSQGAVTVTKATGPSGKAYNRVHLTLTPAQRDAIQGMLSGAGEKGDWVTSSKMSHNVAAGDLLPMRESSTKNPDGTPRWKVDSTIKPPTHEVVGVVDDPNGTGIKIVTLKDRNTGEEITSRFHSGKSLTTYSWDPNKPKAMTAGAFALNDIAKADGWTFTTDGGMSAATGGAQNAKLKVEPGKAVPTSASALGHISHNWQTLRNVSADGVVIETVDVKGSSGKSSTGTTVISVPEGLDETALGAAFARLGIDYSPMTQDSAKTHVRGLLRTLISLDMSDVDTPKHYTDDMLFSEAGKVMGISDLGWHDVYTGVDESTGKLSFFWSDRARNALAKKASYNVIYRAASTSTAAQIVSTVKYGSASSMLKKTTGMLDGSSSVGSGASASNDNGNHAGHGSYASASSHSKLPSSNKFASYKSTGMMVYHRPEAVLGRIMDYRVAGSDAFGAGKGSGANHLQHAVSMGQVKDYFLGGGLPTESVGFVAVDSAANREAAIKQLKADGYDMIGGRPVEEIVITKQKAATMSPDDLPPVTLPANARPITDLPTSYDAPAVTAAAEDEPQPEPAAVPEVEEVVA